MKTPSYLVILFVLTLSACHKSNASKASSGGWLLVQKDWALGAGGGTLTPSKDSAVLLQLNGNGTYVSKLDSKPIAQGSYSITIDTSYYNDQVLELKNFKTTGIFTSFIIFQIGTNGQVVSESDGLILKISNDTLKLSSPLTPGGFVSYTFVKI